MWGFFKDIKIGGQFAIWLGTKRLDFVKSGPTTGFCPATNKMENFSQDCMVKTNTRRCAKHY